jgi:hypothetical protein
LPVVTPEAADPEKGREAEAGSLSLCRMPETF